MLGLTLPHLLGNAALPQRQSWTRRQTFGLRRASSFYSSPVGHRNTKRLIRNPCAPADIRGTFQPIATSVPGVQFCELLPRVAGIAEKLAVVRSFATDDPNHESGGYWVNTGYKYLGPQSAVAESDRLADARLDRQDAPSQRGRPVQHG